MAKQSLHDLIRLLEKKKETAQRNYRTQLRRMKSGLPVRVLPQTYLKKINEYDIEIHELKLKR